MSPQARSAPLARRLQAAKAEPTKPAALALNPDRKPVAKPEPAPPPGPKPEPPPVLVPAPAPQAASEPPGPVPAPLAQPPASEPGPAAEAPALDPRAVLVRDFDWKPLARDPAPRHRRAAGSRVPPGDPRLLARALQRAAGPGIADEARHVSVAL